VRVGVGVGVGVGGPFSGPRGERTRTDFLGAHLAVLRVVDDEPLPDRHHEEGSICRHRGGGSKGGQWGARCERGDDGQQTRMGARFSIRCSIVPTRVRGGPRRTHPAGNRGPRQPASCPRAQAAGGIVGAVHGTGKLRVFGRLGRLPFSLRSSDAPPCRSIRAACASPPRWTHEASRWLRGRDGAAASTRFRRARKRRWSTDELGVDQSIRRLFVRGPCSATRAASRERRDTPIGRRAGGSARTSQGTTQSALRYWRCWGPIFKIACPTFSLFTRTPWPTLARARATRAQAQAPPAPRRRPASRSRPRR
jgi:hypothetical protein